MRTYVQQIMLGTVCKNAQTTLATMASIKAAGYDGIELNQFMVHPSSLMVRLLTRAAGMPTGNGGKLDWHGLLNESGLAVASLHTDMGSLEKDAGAVAEEALVFGTNRLVITGMYRFDYADQDAMLDLADRLNKAGEALRAHGCELLYHNHNVELQHVGAGRRAFDVLIDETDPALVGFEFDSYWFADGGADAASWMRRLGPRMRLWHINDRGHRGQGPFMTPILSQDSMELGCGNMDLDGLWEIACANGVEDVVLESHRNWVDKDPVKSLELSAEWLRGRV